MRAIWRDFFSSLLRDFYRPVEFVCSVGVQLCERPTHAGLSGVIGAQRTSRLAREETSAFDGSTDYIKTPLGGYQLYYRGVMAELGLIVLGGLGLPVTLKDGATTTLPIDVPTEEGSELASRFRQAIEHTKYYRSFFASPNEVPRDVVAEFGEAGCLCALQEESAPDRLFLLDRLLEKAEGSERRRKTFRFLLDIAEQTEGHPIEQADFRRLVYFGENDDQAGRATYRPRAAVASTHKRWRLYQAKEYYAFALNTLWVYFCEWGLRKGGDLPLSAKLT